MNRAAEPHPSLIPELGNERGSVMIISLLMLVLFTIVGATFLTLAGSEGKISTNQRLDTQALFVAESGAQLAYQSFSSNNFQGWTHQSDGTIEAANPLLAMPFPGGLVIDNVGNDGLNEERDDGWMVYEWAPGDPEPPLTQSGLRESMRFAIRPASAAAGNSQFVIDVEGKVGEFRQRLQILGNVEPIFSYALFADGPLSEFTRAEDQLITGKVHANGDMYFRPWDPQTLSIDSPSITATGRMIRTTDIFGRDLYAGSTVQIKDAAGNWVEMELGAPGTAMDSENANWLDDDPNNAVDGAMELWDGIVRDGALGAVSVDPPPVETLDPGGWYDQRAALRIRAGDVQVNQAGTDISTALGAAITERTFWNPAFGAYETVQELDVAQLISSGNFPANGLVYSEVPLRLVNADDIGGNLSVVSAQSVYTKGNFNSINKRPASIIAKGRVWHVSSAWSDDDSSTQGPINARQASNGTTVINAAIVDGQPAVSTAQCADLNGDGNPDDPGAGNCIENADHLLESWGGSRTLRKYGSIVHLQRADMADDLRNQGRLPHEEWWTRFGAYAPPERDYAYDPSFQGLAGQPPFAMLVGRIYLWQQLDS